MPVTILGGWLGSVFNMLHVPPPRRGVVQPPERVFVYCTLMILHLSLYSVHVISKEAFRQGGLRPEDPIGVDIFVRGI